MSDSLNSVITGAGSGLGRALALEIARRGGRVVVSDIDEASADETRVLVERAGSKALALRCDVTDAADVDRLSEEATTWLGEVDFVANNAGVALSGPFSELSLDDWKWIVDINLWGVVHGCRSFLPAMKARGRGYVLNVASMAGLVSVPTLAPYNATKAAVVALSESLYGEYQRHGVQVSVLCPTFFATNIANTGRGVVNERAKARVAKLMHRSRVQAPEVALAAVEGALAGDLYILPMSDGRQMWRLQRLMPTRFYSWLMRRLDFDT
ncbi:SDR family NAD(P)-dependent oxidoreductase [Haliangium ochraceum]|uniref:Short-chain dehydrogenase/reductase SDR n=1 Tax=Haliangium ochraceum (strain DSM 14365 / JCM 11303 / SMP-2) TaxID=502025 RepID=D0LYI2_HALO1|nr:SDR family NAD(P)-dependent oxidoreductase [Haliangium ochraceum]ACY17848.1 short-chain dehydrogenase/reductase SDR [Haliangium ochraceum DSM 14365]